MHFVSKSTSHPITAPSSKPPSSSGHPTSGVLGKIRNLVAQRFDPPSWLKEKAASGSTRKRDSQPLGQRARPEQRALALPAPDVLNRARNSGIKLGPLAKQTAAILGRRGGSRSYAALRYAQSLLEGDDDDYIAYLVPVGDEFRNSEQLARHLWDTQTPDELAELLKDALPESELGTPQDLFKTIKGLDKHGLMQWLANTSTLGIPTRIEDRQALRETIANDIHEFESSSAAADTREVSFFQMAHLATGPDPLGFLSTCVDVASRKEPRTWRELLRSIVQGHPSGASSSEVFKETVRNIILAIGVELEAVRRFFDKQHLEDVHAKLQRVFGATSLIDGLSNLKDEVGRCMALRT